MKEAGYLVSINGGQPCKMTANDDGVSSVESLPRPVVVRPMESNEIKAVGAYRTRGLLDIVLVNLVVDPLVHRSQWF